MSYWCHECLQSFSQAEKSVCPFCNSDFIEWSPEQSPPFTDEEDDDIDEDFYENEMDGLNLFRNPTSTLNIGANFMDYDLAHWLLGLRIGGGGGRPPVGNLGDYGIGQSFDDILNMSFEQQQSSGPPPTAKKELERLKRIKVSKEHIASNLECSVCKEKFQIREQCDLLPCKHFFHQDCIRPWLSLHNTCPICRFELPTDDTDYEASKKNPTTQQHFTTQRSTASPATSPQRGNNNIPPRVRQSPQNRSVEGSRSSPSEGPVTPNRKTRATLTRARNTPNLNNNNRQKKRVTKNNNNSEK